MNSEFKIRGLLFLKKLIKMHVFIESLLLALFKDPGMQKCTKQIRSLLA